jgi:L-rhamnose isomerase
MTQIIAAVLTTPALSISPSTSAGVQRFRYRAFNYLDLVVKISQLLVQLVDISVSVHSSIGDDVGNFGDESSNCTAIATTFGR